MLNKTFSASVTIYLSLCFSLILSLLVYTIESCHLDALAARSEGITYLSFESVFGEYCLPLFEKYGLFCLNEQGMNIEAELKKYATQNCTVPSYLLRHNQSFLMSSLEDITVDKITYITDNDGDDFVNQICDYVKYMEISSLANSLQKDSSIKYPKVFPVDEYGNTDFTMDNIDTSSIDEYVKDSDESSDKYAEEINKLKSPEQYKDNVSTSLEHIIKNGLLSFLVDNPKSVSANKIDKTILPSVTCELSEEGLMLSYGYSKDASETTYKKACFCEYIANTFPCYTDKNTSTPLNYGMEYVIYGSDSDDVNFISCCLQLITLRTGLNLVHLLGSSEKSGLAKKLASVSATVPIPGIVEATQMVILTIWATAEAVLDVRDLVAGKSVVLIKTDNEWNLSLEGLENFSKSTTSKNKGKDGLSYKRYLEMLLAVQNNISVYYRTMDLIQLDICNRINTNFRLSKCVCGIEATFKYQLPFLIMRRKESYTSKGSFYYQ